MNTLLTDQGDPMNTFLTQLCLYLGLKPEHTELLQERDTRDIWRQLAIWLLVDEEYGVICFAEPSSREREAIQQVADLYIQNCKDVDAWNKAAKDAKEIVDDAKLIANLAKIARDAFFCRAFSQFAAFSSAEFFASSAYTPTMDLSASAMEAAADAFAYATNANIKNDLLKNDFKSKHIAVRKQHFILMADKLIELINAAPLMK